VLGFSAILLPQLPREITLSDKSWLASICNLGQLVGALLAGFISNKIGRKHCLLLFTIPLICGWLTLIFNHENVILANLGRTLQGFGMMPSIG
jgi:MFS family permease